MSDTSTTSTATSQSALDLITSTLNKWGLSTATTDLATWAWGEWKAGKTLDQIFVELKSQPAYKARFPAMDTLAQKGHAITEAQYINFEQTYTSILHGAGFPPGFYDDPAQFATWIGNEVSPQEIQDSADLYKQAAFEVQGPHNETTLTQLNRLYGIPPTQSAIASLLINGDKALPLLQRQFKASQLGAIAGNAGFSATLTAAELEALATQGVTAEQARAGFGQLAGEQQLFNQLPGEAGQSITTDEQVTATFDNNAAAQRRIASRAAKRKAEFAAGATTSGTNKGVSGLGSTTR